VSNFCCCRCTNCTVIAIAHRLQTIMDFDEVIVWTCLHSITFWYLILLQVMGACVDRPGGKVLEKDSPKNLLHNHNSVWVAVSWSCAFWLLCRTNNHIITQVHADRVPSLNSVRFYGMVHESQRAASGHWIQVNFLFKLIMMIMPFRFFVELSWAPACWGSE